MITSILAILAWLFRLLKGQQDKARDDGIKKSGENEQELNATKAEDKRMSAADDALERLHKQPPPLVDPHDRSKR